MNKYKISSLSFTFMFICLINALLPGTIFTYLIENTKTSLFFSIIISYIIGLILIYLFLKIFNTLPDKTIFGKIKTIFPKASKFISSLLLIIILLFLTIIFWRLTTFVSTELLIDTPNSFIVVINILPIIYLSLYDIDTASRVSTFCIFIGMFFYFMNVIALFNEVNLSNLMPIINSNVKSLTKSSIVYTLLNITCIFSMLVIPKNQVIDKEKLPRNLYIGYTLSTIFVSAIFLVIIGTLGIELSSLFTFPSYEVLKTLNLFSFLDNIQSINILIWILFMTFSISFYLIFIKTGIRETFNIKTNKKTLLIMSIIFIAILLTILYIIPFENYISKYKNLYIYVPSLLMLIYFIIVLISYIKSKIKRI